MHCLSLLEQTRDAPKQATIYQLTCDHTHIADVKFDKLGHLARLKVHLHCVIGFDQRIRVTNSAPIVGGDVGHTLVTDLVRAHSAELVLQGWVGDKAVTEKANASIMDTQKLI